MNVPAFLYLMKKVIVNNQNFMKKILVLTILTSLIFSACKKELKEIGSPANKVEGIKASWTMTQAIQIDERSLTRESYNLTNYFISKGNMPNVTFTDNTFTVDTTGVPVNYFGGTSGTWSFDDPNAPLYVTFKSVEGNTVTLKLGGPIRPQDNLKLVRDVYLQCKNDKAPAIATSFVLTFNRK
jgi:hypothetical protein